MSKGEILEHKGEGLYRVRQKLAVERIQQELAQVQARLAELAVELPTAKLDLIHADDAVRDKAQEIDDLIPDYAAGADGALQKITTLQAELIRLQSEAGQLRLKVAELIAEDLANRKRQNQLEQVPEGRELDLWCADYSVELTGEVGLVDINDEGGQGTLIQPGFEDGAAYDATRDGALFPNLAQSGPQIYLNAALLPGVQKWLPRYRVGTISNIQNDTCRVQLDDARSSAQNLPINRQSVLEQVPIVYMNCNGSAFTDGDRVVVRFTQSGPLVVGFESEPVPCVVNDLICVPSVMQSNNTPIGYGKPFEDGGGTPINPPLGTLGGTDRAWAFSPVGGSWNTTRGLGQIYGDRNWVGPDKQDVLSWNGPRSRMCALYRWEPSEAISFSGADAVYWKGQVIYSLGFSQFTTLEGAAIHYRNGDRYLRICVSNAQGMHRSRDSATLNLTLWELYWPEGGSPYNPSELATFSASHTFPPCSGAYFSRDGNSMVLTCTKDELGECYVYRWNGGGITESFEQADLSGGSVTIVYDSFSDYIPLTGGTVSTSETRDGSAPAATATLYYDFKGNEETRVSITFPARSDTGAESTLFVMSTGGDPVTRDNTTTADRTRQSGALEVKAGESVIYRSEPLESYIQSTSGSWGHVSQGQTTGDGHYGSLTYNLTDSTYMPDLTTMHVDGRFDLVAVRVRAETYSQTSNESSDEFGQWTRVRDTARTVIARLELWSGGSKVKDDSYVVEDSSNNQTGPINGKSDLTGYEEPYTETYDFTYLINHVAPSIRAEGFLQIAVNVGSFAKSGGKVMASFELTDSMLPTGEFLTVNYVTGVGDPINYFFGKSESSRHVFARVSLI